MEELVSLCMGVFNAEDTIYRTLNSLSSQTYSNFEFIIVDDGSTDETVNIIYNLFCKKDKRFKLFTNIAKQKYVDAHNLSYQLANGKYLFRIDSDDIFNDNYIEFCVNFMDEHPEYCALSTTNYEHIIDSCGNLIMQNKEFWEQALSEEETQFFNDVPLISMVGNTIVWSNPTSCLRGDWYRKYQPKYHYYEMGDYLFWWDVLSKGGKLYKSSEILSYNINSNHNVSGDQNFYLSDDDNSEPIEPKKKLIELKIEAYKKYIAEGNNPNNWYENNLLYYKEKLKEINNI